MSEEEQKRSKPLTFAGKLTVHNYPNL